MQRQVKLSSGTYMLPDSLLRALESGARKPLSPAIVENPASVFQAIDQQADPAEAAALALQAAVWFNRQSQLEEFLTCVGKYLRSMARMQPAASPRQDALLMMADYLTLVHQAILQSGALLARTLLQQLEHSIVDALVYCQTLNQDDLADAVDPLSRMLDITATVWGPELETPLEQLMAIVRAYAALMAAGGESAELQAQAEQLLRSIREMQAEFPGSAQQVRQQARVDLLAALANRWLQVIQQAVFQILNQKSAPQQYLEAEHLRYEAQSLVEQVERQLRVLIARKYHERHGAQWIDAVKNRHAAMFESWTRNMDRDTSVFQSYKDHAPDLLEYARIEDLYPLIAAEWSLFAPVFLFGKQYMKDKQVLHDKLMQIIQVRNPLAHHRTIPENELLRAKVLCTDILLVMERTQKE